MPRRVRVVLAGATQNQAGCFNAMADWCSLQLCVIMSLVTDALSLGITLTLHTKHTKQRRVERAIFYT